MSKLFENSIVCSRSPVTFIIGNGFDIGMGMKTKYSHIYEKYIQMPSNSNVIKRFKNDLSNQQLHDKWSDFEMGMAEYAKTLKSESELIECVRDFKSCMVQHLQSENKRITDLIRDKTYSQSIIQELDRSLDQFYAGFSPNIVNQINQLIGGPFPEHNIITFNYTKVLEELFTLKARIQQIVVKPPLHIHGSLDKDVVLGVDNVAQLDRLSYNISRKGRRAFIKTCFNEQYDESRILSAKKMISESTVICTYGFSMGESDKTWVNCLIEWLQSNVSHHLVVFEHDEIKYNSYNFDELMDVEETKKIY